MRDTELEILTKIDMLPMVEKGIRAGIGHAALQHTKANNKYMKENENKTTGDP